MLALAATGAYMLHSYFNPQAVNTQHSEHPRARGVNGARSFTKTAPERAENKIPRPQRREQPAELKRNLPNPQYREPKHLTIARLNRLYEAQSDGPLGFARGKVDRDRDLISKRMPNYHRGLTKVGINPRETNGQRPPPSF